MELILGFEEKPEGLESFLVDRGYSNRTEGEEQITYETKREGGIAVIIPKIQGKREGDPDWDRSGRVLTHFAYIDSPGTSKAMNDANNLGDDIIRKFRNVVMYSHDVGEFISLEDVAGNVA